MPAYAPSNIAFIKYWGKKDTASNLPMNPSISMTLDSNVSTTTDIRFRPDLHNDVLVLNRRQEFGTALDRVSGFLDIVRKKAKILHKAMVVSDNTFPTGVGIASSASGFAALAIAASRQAGLDLSQEELSALARQGSGSAARSIYGGFVEWQGSHAVQLHPREHWPSLIDIIVLVDKAEKKVSSRQAMQRTVEESLLYQERLKELPSRLDAVRLALAKKHFAGLAQHIMEDSDSMHACIEEVGIRYLTDASRKIKEIIRQFNKGGIRAAYTFDAGPNAHIITLEEHRETLINRLDNYECIVSKIGEGAKWNPQ